MSFQTTSFTVSVLFLDLIDRLESAESVSGCSVRPEPRGSWAPTAAVVVEVLLGRARRYLLWPQRFYFTSSINARECRASAPAVCTPTRAGPELGSPHSWITCFVSVLQELVEGLRWPLEFSIDARRYFPPQNETCAPTRAGRRQRSLRWSCLGDSE